MLRRRVRRVSGVAAAGRAARALAVALLVAAVGLVAIAPTVGAALTSEACRVPRLIGLTFQRARAEGRRAGCQLHTTGELLKVPGVQTVARQSPAAGRRAVGVTVWLSRSVSAWRPTRRRSRSPS